MTDARAPQQGDRDAGSPHHDLPKDAARPVQRTRIRDAMTAARMAPIVSDPWADLREESTTATSPWSAARPARNDTSAETRHVAPKPTRRTRRAIVDLTDERLTSTANEDRTTERTVEPSMATPVADELPAEDRRNTDERAATETALAPRAHFGLGSAWGSRWAASTQGWVRAEDGTVVWRPIVTTTQQLDLWDIDRYLGVVTAEVAASVERVGDRDLGPVLIKAREMGVRGLVTEAIERGAHAVIGVALSYTPVGPRLLVTITGTAVTLREKRS